MSTPPKNQRSSLRQALIDQKWLTLIGLPVLLFSTFNGIYMLWGMLFVFWGITSIRAGEAFLLEAINREEDPALFWIISAMWIVSGVTYVLADIYPEFWL